MDSSGPGVRKVLICSLVKQLLSRMCGPAPQDKAKGDFKPDDEEFEDAQGNVYSKKTYEDLKRQGLL